MRESVTVPDLPPHCPEASLCLIILGLVRILFAVDVKRFFNFSGERFEFEVTQAGDVCLLGRNHFTGIGTRTSPQRLSFSSSFGVGASGNINGTNDRNRSLK